MTPRADRHHAALAALAATDGERARGQVGIVDLERDDLAGPESGLEHDAHDGLVAAVPHGLLGLCALGWRAGLDQGPELVVGERFDDALVELR